MGLPGRPEPEIKDRARSGVLGRNVIHHRARYHLGGRAAPRPCAARGLLCYNGVRRDTQREEAVIPRYSRPEMAAVWTAEARFQIWLDIETHALDALAEIGVAPAEAAAEVRARGAFDVGRIEAIERESRHEMTAFLDNLAEHVGEAARFVHHGMTSSDVMDTCLAVQLSRAADLLIADLDALLAVLRRRADEHKHTPCIGRSHGIHAEPTTFGLKLAQAHAEFARNRARIETARAEIATCAISGAVGTFAEVDPRVEAHVAKALGLVPEPISSQVIPRDRHAAFFAALAVTAASIERLATEIRHLQRTEVGEVEEAFAAGQKGSSAMPHKRNPILSENLTGLARAVRAAVVPALENVALWHERDISHSSVERMIAPDATVTLDFALARLTALMEALVVYPEAMARNLERLGGLVHSQAVMLALVESGLARAEAYRVVQDHAMAAHAGNGDFRDLVEKDANIAARLPPAKLAALFDADRYAAHVDTIFARVFAE